MIYPSVSDHHLLLEQYLERQALEICRPESFLGVVTVCGLAEAILVPLAKGKSIYVRASDIWAARHKWLAVQELGEVQYCLSQLVVDLVIAFLAWLTTSYTPRYRGLITDEQRAWLSQVALLVVVRYLMEEKHARFLTAGRPTFADAWVGHVMEHLYLDHQLEDRIAPVLKKMKGEPPEQWRPMTASFLQELDEHMSRYPFVQPEPLPPLPPDVRLPYVLPMPIVREQGSSSKRRAPVKGDA